MIEKVILGLLVSLIIIVVIVVMIAMTEEIPESPNNPKPTVTVTVTPEPKPQTNWEILWTWGTKKGHADACTAYRKTPKEFYQATIETDLNIETWGQTEEEYHKFFKSKCS